MSLFSFKPQLQGSCSSLLQLFSGLFPITSVLPQMFHLLYLDLFAPWSLSCISKIILNEALLNQPTHFPITKSHITVFSLLWYLSQSCLGCMCVVTQALRQHRSCQTVIGLVSSKVTDIQEVISIQLLTHIFS